LGDLPTRSGSRATPILISVEDDQQEPEPLVEAEAPEEPPQEETPPMGEHEPL
jgi:hypothetical protein